jgi:hypothetical protein
MRAANLFAVCLLASCGGSSSADDLVPTGYQPLLSGDWTMPPGEEGYYCVRATVPETMYIHGFKPIAPPGTHHTAFAIDLQGGPDEGFPCRAQDVGFKLLFGSGLGTTPYELPDGVAFVLEAGTQVLLNLHLYNTTDAPISGTSGVEIERIAEADVVHEAEVVYALDTSVSVPPGESVATHTCTFNAPSTIVGVFPHMHKLGRRMTASLDHEGAAPQQFFDQPYSFEEQLNYATDLIEVGKGDKITYACGYANPTGSTVEFGDSTDAEMCVLGMYRYPSQGAISLCID